MCALPFLKLVMQRVQSMSNTRERGVLSRGC